MNGAIVWHDISRWQVMRIMTVPSGHLGRTAAIHLGYAGSVFQGSSIFLGTQVSLPSSWVQIFTATFENRMQQPLVALGSPEDVADWLM